MVTGKKNVLENRGDYGRSRFERVILKTDYILNASAFVALKIKKKKRIHPHVPRPKLLADRFCSNFFSRSNCSH